VRAVSQGLGQNIVFGGELSERSNAYGDLEATTVGLVITPVNYCRVAQIDKFESKRC